MGVEGVTLTLEAARRAIAQIDPDEAVSPYRREGFEPILRACQARLDAEGGTCQIHGARARSILAGCG